MKKIIAYMVAVSLLGLIQAQAEVIAHYGFGGVATSVDTQTNTTAGVFGLGAGVTAFGYSGLSAETPQSIDCNNNSFYSTTEGAAISANDYFTFSIDVDAGYDIDFDTLSFYTLRSTAGGVGAPNSFAIYSSENGFAAPIGTGVGAIVATTGTTFTQHMLDLSGIQDLQAVSGTTEFRIYMWTTNGIAGTDERQFRMDDVKVEGTVHSGAPPAVVNIAKYEFQNTAESSDQESNTTAGVFAVGPGVNSFFYSALGTPPKSIDLNNSSFYQTTRSGAIMWDDYLTFSVSVAPGYIVSYDSLTFYTLRRETAGKGAPDSYSVYTSQDGFATSVGTHIGGIVTAPDDSTTFTKHTVDLSGFANLRSVSGTTEFRIYMWTTNGIESASERQLRLDEVSLDGAVEVAPTGVAAYEAWIASFPEVGTATNQTDNPDGDSQNNLYEWGLGGNPADAGDVGHVSTFGTIEDGGTNYLEYVYAARTNATSIGLEYYLETSTDLLYGTWTNDNYDIVNVGTLGGEFHSVTNRVSIDSETKKFLRLVIKVVD